MKDLQEPARDLRNNMTEPEKKIWFALLSNKKLQYRFLRQHPIGPFIPDFYCRKLKLIIEIDGASHTHQKAYDKERTLFLNNRGIKVIRFWNNDVLNNLDGVESQLIKIITEIEKKLLI